MFNELIVWAKKQGAYAYSLLYTLLCGLVKLSLLTIIAIFLYTCAIDIVGYGMRTGEYLRVVDKYAQLLLTSWPATILTLGLLLFVRQHSAIDYFIRSRLTSIGPDGLHAAPITQPASDTEVKQKAILEDKEEQKVTKNIQKQLTYTVTADSRRAEVEGVEANDDAFARYKRAATVEEMVQTMLIARYGDRYAPKVKITVGDIKPLILDGIIYSKLGIKSQAVEIKYVSRKSFDALRFILTRLKEKLILAGIRRLTVVVVSDGLTEEDAIKIQEQNLNIARMYFFNLTGDKLESVPIPSRHDKFL